MNPKLAEALEGCTKAVVLDDRKDALLYVMALTTCPHGHPFVVINGTRSIITTDEAIRCLREQGVNIP
jgi:hypothetical protein